MIPESLRGRFAGDSGIDLGSHEIDVVFPANGERRRIALRLGTPYRVSDGETKLRVELENLDRTDGPISGSDSFQVIILWLRFLAARLEIFQRKHGC